MLNRDVVFDKLTTSRSETNDGLKKNVAREIPIIKEVASRENQPEEQLAPEDVRIEPTSLAQSRAKRTIKPTKRYIEACYAFWSVKVIHHISKKLLKAMSIKDESALCRKK